MSEDIIRFAHISDCHLGKYLGKNKVRYEDMFIAFRKALEIITGQEPTLDFVIITGDLFQDNEPHARTLEDFYKMISKVLKKLPNLKIIIIPGNHEFKLTASLMKNRYGLKLLTYSKFYENLIILNDDIYFLKIRTNLPPVLIYGIKYYSGENSLFQLKNLFYSEKSKTLTRDYPKAAKILMLHQYTTGMQELGIDISHFDENQLAEFDFNYIGVGHNHFYWEKPQLNLMCPGSTEHVSMSDWGKNEENQERCVIIGDLEPQENRWKLNYNRKTFKVRPKQKLTLELGKVSSDEAYKKVEKELNERIMEEACVYVKVNGKLPIEEDNYFDLSPLERNLKREKRLVELEIDNNLFLDVGAISETSIERDDILKGVLTEIFQMSDYERNKYTELINLIENSTENIKSTEDLDDFFDNFIG